MQRALQLLLYGIGLPLEVLVLWAMVRSRAYRKFPLVFAYSSAIFVASLIEVPAYLAYFSGAPRSRTRAFYYWINEGILQALIFAAVISLVYMATAALENRTAIRRGIVAGAVLFGAGSIAIHYDPTAVTGEWMTLVSRDLNFCSAGLDLALWMLLLTFRRADHRLLLLSGGLGIQFTGEAIGHSLRQVLPRSLVLVGSTVVVLANLICMYVWWQTFRATASEGMGRTKAGVKSESGPQARPAD
jgi:hypothetical protein